MKKYLRRILPLPSLILCMLLLFAAPVWADPPENAEREGASGYDVVFVIDNSRSVWSQAPWRNEAFANITDIASGKDVRIGATFFADHIYSTLELTSVETAEGTATVKNFLNMTERDNNNISTNIGNALKSAIELLSEPEDGRQQIIILFSDGINENAAGDESYKQAADQLTSEQVAILKEADIPIYCVYLQKARNDEAYLMDLVNYFSPENHFTEDRFDKVTAEEIDTLSDTFEDVFYVMEEEVIEIQQEIEEQKAEEAAAESTEAESTVTESASEEVVETVSQSEAAVEEPVKLDDPKKPINPLIFLPLLLIPILIAIVLGMKAMRKKQHKAEVLQKFARAQSDYRLAKERSIWTRSDFDTECEQMTRNMTNVKRPDLGIAEQAAPLLSSYEAILAKSDAILATRDSYLAEGLKLLRTDKDDETAINLNNLDEVAQVTEGLEPLTGQLNTNSDALKEINLELKKLNRTLARMIMTAK